MDITIIVASLHPLERKVLPVLGKAATLKAVMEATGLKDVEVMRALQWLENKKVVKIKSSETERIILDQNGVEYVKRGLPEKRFLESLKSKPLTLDEIKKKASLDVPELNACIGLLKSKAAIALGADKKVTITKQGETLLTKRWLEEEFLKQIAKTGRELSSLTPEEKFALNIFQKRKKIVQIAVQKKKAVSLTELGKKLSKVKLDKSKTVDRLTPDMIKTSAWKNQTFRRYDVEINVPKVHRGKRHFVNQSWDYIKSIWLEMGFEEMEGSMIQTSFWNFDALFTAQDHPVREMQDTFFIESPRDGSLPDKKTVEGVKTSHETGKNCGSKGWRYTWAKDAAQKNVLRTHTTALSAQTISRLKESDLPAKFFAVGKAFRNETVDWSHLFELTQVEGIVIDPNATFKHLLGYLQEFYAKMGFSKVRIRPAYFPYTEPSCEVDVWHPVHKKWVELGGAGIFRPEVVIPLLGKDIPVLAWGQGLERGIMEYFNITDIRELYKNDLKQMREMKEWMR